MARGGLRMNRGSPGLARREGEPGDGQACRPEAGRGPVGPGPWPFPTRRRGGLARPQCLLAPESRSSLVLLRPFVSSSRLGCPAQGPAEWRREAGVVRGTWRSGGPAVRGRPPFQDSCSVPFPGRPVDPAGVPAPPGKAVTSPVRVSGGAGRGGLRPWRPAGLTRRPSAPAAPRLRAPRGDPEAAAEHRGAAGRAGGQGRGAGAAPARGRGG